MERQKDKSTMNKPTFELDWRCWTQHVSDECQYWTGEDSNRRAVAQVRRRVLPYPQNFSAFVRNFDLTSPSVWSLVREGLETTWEAQTCAEEALRARRRVRNTEFTAAGGYPAAMRLLAELSVPSDPCRTISQAIERIGVMNKQRIELILELRKLRGLIANLYNSSREAQCQPRANSST
jgi:hypothetical protein